jgi:cell division protein FtsB
MRSRWRNGPADEQQPPVEMRFIDMFMTALGGLVFLCLLLVFLLPKVTQSPAQENLEEQNRQLRQDNEKLSAENRQIKGLIAENQQLNKQLQQLRTEDLAIIERWLGVFVLASGCNNTEPEIYVRWEGDVIDAHAVEQLGVQVTLLQSLQISNRGPASLRVSRRAANIKITLSCEDCFVGDIVCVEQLGETGLGVHS